MSEKYLEDFAAGQTYGSGRLTVDKDRIQAFAAEFDPQPFHMDEEAARGSIFRGLVASGWHTAALTMRPLVESELKAAAGSWAPASRNFAGCCRCGPATSCTSRAKCWKCGLRSRARLKD